MNNDLLIRICFLVQITDFFKIHIFKLNNLGALHKQYVDKQKQGGSEGGVAKCL